LHDSILHRRGNYFHPTLTPEILSGIVKIFDFCLVLTAAFVAFPIYCALATHPVGPFERYFWSSLLVATLFVGGIQFIEGYTLKRLSNLRWQVTRSAVMWLSIIFSMLAVAILAKVSPAHLGKWAIGWSATALAPIIHQVA
jgi:hypothetical protein